MRTDLSVPCSKKQLHHGQMDILSAAKNNLEDLLKEVSVAVTFNKENAGSFSVEFDKHGNRKLFGSKKMQF